jgi:hypothetical protein
LATSFSLAASKTTVSYVHASIIGTSAPPSWSATGPGRLDYHDCSSVASIFLGRQEGMPPARLGRAKSLPFLLQLLTELLHLLDYLANLFHVFFFIGFS